MAYWTSTASRTRRRPKIGSNNCRSILSFLIILYSSFSLNPKTYKFSLFPFNNRDKPKAEANGNDETATEEKSKKKHKKDKERERAEVVETIEAADEEQPSKKKKKSKHDDE